MSRLCANSLPADRMVGCTFAERLRTAAEVALNGGTVHGAPVFSGGGMICDGANDYIVYVLEGHEFYSDEITFEQEFWPDFATDENKYRYFFNTPAGVRFSFSKQNNAASNILSLILNGRLFPAIPEATYSPFWNINGRNCLQIVSKSGNTIVRLNKNTILTSALAWTKKAPTIISIGATTAGNNKFKGKLGPIKIYQSLLTERDHYNTYYNKAYGFTNDAVAYFPMTNARHDAANNRTLDVSGYNNHAVWTPGAATPTKDTRRGYYFDGGDYMLAPATGIFNRPEVGIVIEFTPHFATDEDAHRHLCDSSNGSRYYILRYNAAGGSTLRIHLGNTTVAVIAHAVWSSYWRQDARNVITISSDGSLTDVHLNEGLILDAGATAWTAKDPANFIIGNKYSFGLPFLGDIHSMMIFPYLLTPRMAADLRHNRRNSIGEV